MSKVDKSAVSDATAFFISRPAAMPPEEPLKKEETQGLVSDEKPTTSEEGKNDQIAGKKAAKKPRTKKPSSGAPKVKKGFLISEIMDKKIDLVAAELGFKKSELVEKALEEYFDKHCSDEKKGS